MSKKITYYCDYPGCDALALMGYGGRDYCDAHYEVRVESAVAPTNTTEDGE